MWICECGNVNGEEDEICKKCGTERTKKYLASQEPQEPNNTMRRLKIFMCVGAIIVALTGIWAMVNGNKKTSPTSTSESYDSYDDSTTETEEGENEYWLESELDGKKYFKLTFEQYINKYNSTIESDSIVDSSNILSKSDFVKKNTTDNNQSCYTTTKFLPNINFSQGQNEENIGLQLIVDNQTEYIKEIHFLSKTPYMRNNAEIVGNYSEKIFSSIHSDFSDVAIKLLENGGGQIDLSNQVAAGYLEQQLPNGVYSVFVLGVLDD